MTTDQRFILTRSAGNATRSPPSPPPVPPTQEKAAEGGCGCGGAPRPRPPSFPDVRVNGVEIDAQAIAHELQHHPAADPLEAWTAAVRALVVRRLLAEEARRLALVATPEIDGTALETEEEALVRVLLEQVLQPATPDPAECRRFYDSQSGRFRTPDLFEAAHILLEPETDDEAGWMNAEALARRLSAEIGDSRTAFVEAAREHSSCPSAPQDGSLGQVRRGELTPAVQAALEDTVPGTNRAEPVRSRFGWHLLRLERRIPGRTLPYDTVSGRILDMLDARAWALAAGQYVSELASKATIEGIELAPPESGPCAAC